MTTTVTAMMKDHEAAASAVRALLAAGIGRDDVSVIVKETPHHAELVQHETEDAQRGALSGALIGGVFSGLLVGVMAVPVLGLVAVGPILAALAASGTGAAAGGVIGALVGHGLSLQVAQEYETALSHGGALVGVHTVHAEVPKVRRILLDAGGTNLSDSVRLLRDHPRSATQDDA